MILLQLRTESPLTYLVDGNTVAAAHFGPCTCPTGPHEWDYINPSPQEFFRVRGAMTVLDAT